MFSLQSTIQSYSMNQSNKDYTNKVLPLFDKLKDISSYRTDKHHVAGFFGQKDEYCFKKGSYSREYGEEECPCRAECLEEANVHA